MRCCLSMADNSAFWIRALAMVTFRATFQLNSRKCRKFFLAIKTRLLQWTHEQVARFPTFCLVSFRFLNMFLHALNSCLHSTGLQVRDDSSWIKGRSWVAWSSPHSPIDIAVLILLVESQRRRWKQFALPKVWSAPPLFSICCSGRKLVSLDTLLDRNAV